jgi:hypothetical protein
MSHSSMKRRESPDIDQHVVRRPGIEPGSKRWQRSIITLKTTLVHGTEYYSIMQHGGKFHISLGKFHHESFNKSIWTRILSSACQR